MNAEELAAALDRLGPSEIEKMAWSSLRYPEEYEGDAEDNILLDDPYPMASLANAILRELDQ